jgi:hypothetical protein
LFRYLLSASLDFIIIALTIVHFCAWYPAERGDEKDVAHMTYFSLITLVFRIICIILYIFLIVCGGTDAFYLRATLTFAQFGYCILMGMLASCLKREKGKKKDNPRETRQMETIVEETGKEKEEKEPLISARPHPSYIFRSELKGRSKEHVV